MSVAQMPAQSSSAAKSGPLAVQSYLCFEGRCEEALAFYTKVLDAKVTMQMRFGDAPGPNEGGCDGGGTPPPADKIIHASFRIGATELFATDGMCKPGGAKFDGIALSLPVPDVATADRVFAALADGGRVQMPLGATFYSPRFGMVMDRFGVTWMVIVPGAPM